MKGQTELDKFWERVKRSPTPMVELHRLAVVCENPIRLRLNKLSTSRKLFKCVAMPRPPVLDTKPGTTWFVINNSRGKVSTHVENSKHLYPREFEIQVKIPLTGKTLHNLEALLTQKLADAEQLLADKLLVAAGHTIITAKKQGILGITKDVCCYAIQNSIERQYSILANETIVLCIPAHTKQVVK
jgi:hypothetical protein